MAASGVEERTEATSLSNQISTITQECLIDRDLLAKAVTQSGEVTLEDFAFVKQISVENFPLTGLSVADLVENISIPISLEDFSKLKDNSEKSDHGQGLNISYDPSMKEALEINGSRVCSLISENIDLSSLIIHHMGWPSNELLNVQAKLRKLMLYEIGGHYIYDFNPFDTIGTVILQIPIEKGHEGGHCEVKQFNGITRVFKTDSNSDGTFYLSFLHGQCKHSMDKVTKGCKLALVFDLVCTNTKTIVPSDFPVFLTAIKEIKQSLNPWVLDFSKRNLSHNDEIVCSEKSLEEQILFFDLKENYGKRNLTFQLLRGKDKKLAHLLQFCSFLDVHLVNFTPQKPNITQPQVADVGESSAGVDQEKFGQWIDTDDIIRNLTLKLDREQQCVGPFRPCVSSSTVLQEKDSTSGSTTMERCTHHSALVIWPKHLSVWIYCRYGLPSLISRMENLLVSTSHWQNEERKMATRDLHQLISFCCAQPKLVWAGQPEMQKGELTSKLLNFCIALRARDEGLDLLKALGKNFEEHTQELEKIKAGVFEGIQSEQVAQAIAKFQCQIAGWHDMAELVERLITPNRISTQLIPIIKLAEYLLEVNCVEGANMVGDSISSSFSKMEHGAGYTQASKVTHYCVQTYLGMVLLLERNPRTSSHSRMESFVIFFSRLRSSVQCRLVLNLVAQNGTLLKITKLYGFMFHDMCRILSTDCKIYVPPVRCIAVDLLQCFIQLGNVEWLESLISRICRVPEPPEIPGIFNAVKMDLIATLISASELWELTESSESIRSALTSFVKSYLILLVDHSSTLIESGNTIPAIPDADIYRRETLLKSFSSSILFFMRMERMNYSIESFHLSVISLVLTKLSVHQFFRFLIDIFQQFTTAQHFISSAIIRHVSSVLSSRMEENLTVMPRREDILDVIKCFIQTKDESLIRSLLDQVCANEITGYWPLHEKHTLFKNLMLCDVWGKLTAKKKSLILNTCDHIITNGINDVIRKLDSASVSTNIMPVLFECVQLFLLTEKNRFSDEQCGVAKVFQPLLAKLSISHLMDLVVNLFMWERNEYPSLKKIPRIDNWYRDACRRFFSLNFLPVVKSEVERAIKILNCLLWLNDDICWQKFRFQICASFPFDESNLFVILASREDIRKALLDSPSALNSIVAILSHWIVTLNSSGAPQFSWKQPKAVVHGHPQVEAFLRSDAECMSYFKLTSTKDSRCFCKELKENGPLYGFSVKAKTHCKNGKFSHCEILKEKSHHDHLLKEFMAKKNEVKGLEKLRESLLEEQRATANINPFELRRQERTDESTSIGQTAGEVHIIHQPTAAKRMKQEIEIIVID